MKKLNVYASANSENHIRKHGSCIVTDHQPDEAQLRPSLLLIAEDGEQLPEVPEWIKCSDRLPDQDDKPVLVKADTGWGHEQHFAAFLGIDDTRDTYWIMDLPQGCLGVDIEIPNVTHWQPLPKAPHQ